MNKVFNSIFENSLRILLLLDEFCEAQNIDAIYIADFLALYGKPFGLSSESITF